MQVTQLQRPKQKLSTIFLLASYIYIYIFYIYIYIYIYL